MLCSVQLVLYLERGGGLVGLHKLSPGGLLHHLPPWGGHPDSSLDLVVVCFSGDQSVQHAKGIGDLVSVVQ
jgi:hypothetical protein